MTYKSFPKHKFVYVSQAVLDGAAPDRVATTSTLKVRKGAFDALKKGSGALGK